MLSRTRWLLLFSLSISLLALLGVSFVVLANSSLGYSSTTLFAPQRSAVLIVNVAPGGSKAFLDGKFAGTTPIILKIAPGKHTIRIEQENYRPLEREISLKVGEHITLESSLIYKINKELIALNVKQPYWDTAGDLLYLNLDDMTLYRRDPSREQRLATIPEKPYTLAFSPLGNYAAVHVYDNGLPEMMLISLLETQTITISKGAFTTTWSSDGQSYYFTGCLAGDAQCSDKNYELWMSQPGLTPQLLNLPHKELAFLAEAIGWAGDMSWLSVQQAEGNLNIWQFEGSNLNYSHTIEGAYGATWAPTADARMVYISKDGTVYYLEHMNASTPQVLTNTAVLPLIWTPDGRRLVFTTYNPQNSGSSFWAIDVETANKILLADSSMILSQVVDFAISPDGLKIAYINDLGQLWILTLGE